MSQANTASIGAADGSQGRSGVAIRLSVMMFLQYAVWGIWLLILPKYLTTDPAGGGLGFTEGQKGLILALGAAVGAVLAPFIAGQLADRYLNAEKALAGLLFLGGLANIAMGYAHDFTTFLLLTIAYSILYMPTLSLTNSISFQNLRDPTKQFPMVRVWGTIGWIAGAALFPLLWQNSPDPVENTRRIADALKVSGVVSILYAVYCVVALPPTPPKRSADSLAFLKAFALLKNPAFLVLVLVTLPISMIHTAFFFQFQPFITKGVGIADKYFGLISSIGQVSEICFLFILGFIIKRLGFKWVLVLGTLGYVARYAIFAVGQPPALVIAAQAFHGMCYACYFATAFILVEKIAPADIRHSAQTVFGIIILGMGPVLTGFYNTAVVKAINPAGSLTTLDDYRKFWTIQTFIALACGAVIAFTMRAIKDKDVPESAFPVASPSGETSESLPA
jgi:nucleoside transporter